MTSATVETSAAPSNATVRGRVVDACRQGAHLSHEARQPLGATDKELKQHAQSALDWHYQRDAAARAVRDFTGVTGVVNNIIVKPRVKTADFQDKIEAAFKRSAEIDARRVNVTAQDGKVILSGKVDDRLAIVP